MTETIQYQRSSTKCARNPGLEEGGGGQQRRREAPDEVPRGNVGVGPRGEARPSRRRRYIPAGNGGERRWGEGTRAPDRGWSRGGRREARGRGRTRPGNGGGGNTEKSSEREVRYEMRETGDTSGWTEDPVGGVRFGEGGDAARSRKEARVCHE